MTDFKNEVTWIALANALGPCSSRLKPLLARFGTPEGIFNATKEELLAAVPDMGKGALAALSADKQYKTAVGIAKRCYRDGIRILTPNSEGYPSCLFAIAQPPAVLYCKGKLPRLSGAPIIGVVGKREIDAYGGATAYKLSFELAAAGAVIVSGLALGVDGIAAAAALDAGGSTVAVLGSGIDVAYPYPHKTLYSEVAEFGTVLSEYPPGAPPNGWHFPQRNRIISALSEAVLVVQADEKSGAMITARHALVQGKSIFAVPGNIDNPLSAGCNLLLRGGANIVLCAEDILSHFRFLYGKSIGATLPPEAMQYTALTEEKLRAHRIPTDFLSPEGKEKKKRTRAEKKEGKKAREEEPRSVVAEPPVSLEALDPAQREIAALLPDGPFTVDALVAKGVAPRDAVAAMTMLEIYGILTSRPGGIYEKK